MSMAIVGSGLVSPFGLSPQEHAFFLRVGLPTPPATPFLDDEDKPVRVNYCRWIRLDQSTGSRMARLAEVALDSAIGQLEEHRAAPHTPLFLCVPSPRAGTSSAMLDELERVLEKRYRPSLLRRFAGEAGIFAALVEARAEVERVEGARVTVVAVDSYVSLDYLIERRNTPPTKWMQSTPHPAEGAAALTLMRQPAGRKPMGHIEASIVAPDVSNDENDEPPHGIAMTAVLRALATSPVQFVFGQAAVDALRRKDWTIAVARHQEPFRAGWLDESIENRVGLLGAASGAASIAYGLAVLRHDTASVPRSGHGPFLAWAISRNGLRGMARIRLEDA